MTLENYPKNFEENIKFRAEMLKQCEMDDDLRLRVMALSKKDILFWVNTFCTTKDPRRDPSVLPFITYPFQDNYITNVVKAIDEQYDFLTEKSRDMGASWMVLYVFIHKWLFEDGSDFRVGSRKEEFVDKPKVMDTLFEKMRFCVEYLPGWMKPEGFDWRKHSSYMKIHNPELGNTIVGESANADFGSGGRSKAILLDEMSKWESAVVDAAWTATGDVSKCRLPVSTPKGSGNKFATLSNGYKEKIAKISLHWTLHPLKSKGAYYIDDRGKKIPLGSLDEAFAKWNELKDQSAPHGLKGGRVRSPWYDGEAERRTEADLAQEVDINYLKSGSPFFDMLELEKHREWEFMTRRSPGQAIPNGFFIRANLVEVDNKIKILERADGWVKIFEMPRKEHQYALGSDSAEGLPKGDESVAIVLDKWTLNTQAVINGIMPPEDLAYRSFLLEKLYNNANNAPENNNHGYTTAKELEDLGSNLYYTRVEEHKKGQTRITPKRGWSTTSRTRRPALDQMAEEIRKHATELRDPDLIAQCRVFVRNEKRGEPEADGSFLDDLVMARSIAGAVIQQLPYKAKAMSRKNRSRAEGKARRRAGVGSSFSNV